MSAVEVQTSKSAHVHYPVSSSEELRRYCAVYIPLVNEECRRLGIDLTNPTLHPDHLGLQVLDKTDFEDTDNALRRFAAITKDSVLHKRRNKIYRFHQPIVIDGFVLPGIEIFEPKPGEDKNHLRAGIEHIAFVVDHYDEFKQTLVTNNVPIAKEADYGDGKFMKTIFCNGVEVEFRETPLVTPNA